MQIRQLEVVGNFERKKKMSCEDCKDAEELVSNHYSLGHKLFYRWGNARIVIIACTKHGKEIVETLNKAQKEKEK